MFKNFFVLCVFAISLVAPSCKPQSSSSNDEAVQALQTQVAQLQADNQEKDDQLADLELRIDGDILDQSAFTRMNVWYVSHNYMLYTVWSDTLNPDLGPTLQIHGSQALSTTTYRYNAYAIPLPIRGIYQGKAFELQGLSAGNDLQFEVKGEQLIYFECYMFAPTLEQMQYCSPRRIVNFN